MKIRVTMKCPDALSDGIFDAVNAVVAPIRNEDERDAAEALSDSAQVAAVKWFKYGEYLTVELDTEAGTCVVVPV